MYLPKNVAEDDLGACNDRIRANDFALLVAPGDGRPFASHLPFLLDRERGPNGTLVAHMARANPHWRAFDGGAVPVVFAGPHVYVSPSWYVTAPTGLAPIDAVDRFWVQEISPATFVVTSVQFSPEAATQLMPFGMVKINVQVSPSRLENTSIRWPLLARPIATGCSA